MNEKTRLGTLPGLIFCIKIIRGCLLANALSETGFVYIIIIMHEIL